MNHRENVACLITDIVKTLGETKDADEIIQGMEFVKAILMLQVEYALDPNIDLEKRTVETVSFYLRRDVGETNQIINSVTEGIVN